MVGVEPGKWWSKGTLDKLSDGSEAETSQVERKLETVEAFSISGKPATNSKRQFQDLSTQVEILGNQSAGPFPQPKRRRQWYGPDPAAMRELIDLRLTSGKCKCVRESHTPVAACYCNHTNLVGWPGLSSRRTATFQRRKISLVWRLGKDGDREDVPESGVSFYCHAFLALPTRPMSSLWSSGYSSRG